MKPLAFIILSDPIHSHKPAEAFRVASGMLALGHPVFIVVSQAALRIFSKPLYELIDSTIVEQSFALLNKYKAALYILDVMRNTAYPVTTATLEQHARLYPEMRYECIDWTRLCEAIEQHEGIFIF
jgi:sulfur relay (sulfurtransferase) DsrF/TusC family protein